MEVLFHVLYHHPIHRHLHREPAHLEHIIYEARRFFLLLLIC